jgi:phosphoribosylanthranilate isomerase
MPLKVKICGLTTPRMLDTAQDAGADFVGLVFYPPSPRSLSIGDAVALLAAVRRRASVVALTVDMPIADLAVIAERVKPDYWQLHGAESVQTIQVIKKQFGIPVIKALAVRTGHDLESAHMYASVADWLLLDAPPPPNSLPGGNNRALDWALLKDWRSPLPWLLAGGLNIDTVKTALAHAQPTAVDVSSGVESERGIKSMEKIRAFIDRCRSLG